MMFTASLRVTGPNQPLLRFLGKYFDAVEDFANAETYFAAAVACDPDSAEAQAQWIRALLTNGRVDKARAAFEMLMERNPSVARQCADVLRTWRSDGSYAIPNADVLWAHLEECGMTHH
jgi:pentatricopeptide repeat protein